MPDRKKMKVGNKIRLLRVPEDDMEQRRSEITKDIDKPGWTANTIELIIAQNPIVEIDSIDDFGSPWFTCELIVNGKLEKHTLAIIDDDSWELI